MPLRNQKQVMAGLDRLAGRSLRGASADYRDEVVAPLVAAIEGARGVADLRRRLGPGLLRRMKSDGLEERLAETLTQADLIGRVAATPAGRNDA